MSEPSQFPVILDWADTQTPRSIPWGLVARHWRQVYENHCGQTLNGLAMRGGLGIEELYYALRDLPLEFNRAKCVSVDHARAYLLERVRLYEEDLRKS